MIQYVPIHVMHALSIWCVQYVMRALSMACPYACMPACVCVCAHMCVVIQALLSTVWCMQILTTPIHAHTLLRSLPCMVCVISYLAFDLASMRETFSFSLASAEQLGWGGGEHLSDWGHQCAKYMQ